MARRPNHFKKPAKLQLEQLERKCRYCKTHQSSHRFDKHEAWCKTSYTIKQELKQRTRQRQHTHIMTSPRLETPAPVSSCLRDSDVNEESVEVSSSEIPIGPTICHAVDSHVFTGGNHEVGLF